MSRVTAKYQITIPTDVRRELHLVPGCEVDIVKRKNQYILLVNPIEKLKEKWQGRFRGKQTSDEYLDDIRGPL